MVYSVTIIESQIVMHWQLTIEYFGPIIQHIDGVENMVDGTLSRLPSAPNYWYEFVTRRAQSRANELFSTIAEQIPIKLSS